MAFAIVLFFIVAATNQVYCADPVLGYGLPRLVGTRIVGGEDAKRGKFPHHVSLQSGYEWQTSHFCSGSILNEQWILTAAHCVEVVPQLVSFVVKAGKHRIKSDGVGEQSVPVEQSFVHEKYNGGVGPYDIALLKLKRPLKLNKNVAAIKLPKAGSVPTGNVTLSGWGKIWSTGETIYRNVLQRAVLSIIDLNVCKSSVEALVGWSPLHESNICTAPLPLRLSTCSGDNGSPLISKNDKGNVEIVGVVSWGVTPDGYKDAPSVYTRVSAHIEWINSTMSKHQL
ncbi:hypothetical protein QAD02_003953 [Eretmocerus hayati]|uniref:Uncharacterized protein n=1 Tax=Eretmocerus hayati TaxID=131215 RepID=A0ACC2NPC8_9HYME|nr:hypothetical protein QAD02_003953 [Eretmocerus hayati]